MFKLAVFSSFLAFIRGGVPVLEKAHGTMGRDGMNSMMNVMVGGGQGKNTMAPNIPLYTIPINISEAANDKFQLLFRGIFSGYHRELVPTRPTPVRIDLLLNKIKSTIEKEGILESVIALFMVFLSHFFSLITIFKSTN